MKRYSEFINFPIYIWASKEVDVEVPADEDDSSDEEDSCMYIFKSSVGSLHLYPVSRCCFGVCSFLYIMVMVI